MLRSLRDYLRAQSQGHHTVDRLEERGVERGSARRSSFKGRERAIVNQTNTGTVSKATLGKRLSERRGGAHMGFPESRTELRHLPLFCSQVMSPGAEEVKRDPPLTTGSTVSVESCFGVRFTPRVTAVKDPGHSANVQAAGCS